jgi:hypothetical protein
MTTTVYGIEDFREKMAGLPDLLKRKALRKALTDAADPVLDAAQAAAPLLTAKSAKKNRYRLAGTLRNALEIRSSRVARQQGNIGVFVNVRPLKGNTYTRVRVTNFKGGKRTKYILKTKSARSAQNPHDPYYWYWVFKGIANTASIPPRDFLTPGAAQLGKALEIFQKELALSLRILDSGGKI